jgi:hypothetical protein
MREHSIDDGAPIFRGREFRRIHFQHTAHQFRRRATGAANEKPRPAVRPNGVWNLGQHHDDASPQGRIFMPYKSFECKCIDGCPQLNGGHRAQPNSTPE